MKSGNAVTIVNEKTEKTKNLKERQLSSFPFFSSSLNFMEGIDRTVQCTSVKIDYRNLLHY